MALREQLEQSLSGAYTIERELGGGGMSRVFVATEQALGRPVVVKVLPSEMAGAVSMERFRREIRLAASLQQANIVPVLSAGDAEGVAYYTMPFVKGESLRSHLAAKGALPIAECVAILRDVARALAYAHGEGVVHRDIKPENILLSGGTAVVTDFGIAKAVAASTTQPGMATLTQMGIALGTPAYMAPEQAVGEDVDHRADIYALGVVAYEMLTGATPFAGRSAQSMLAAHVMEAPPALAKTRADVPQRLADLVSRCLAKEQADRPQSAAAVIESLEIATTPAPSAPGAVATPARTTMPDSRASTIAVLPFANVSADADAEYFSEGMSEEVLNALVRVPGLRVIARTSSFAFKGKTTDIREIGERLGAGIIVEGSVRKAPGRIRVTAQLIDATSGVQLWSERYDRALDDVFAVQDEITAAIRDALSEKLAGIGALPRPKPVIDTETYELFLRARFQLTKLPEGLVKGSASLEQVVLRAPDYEPALADLSQALILQSNFGMIEPRDANPRAIALAQRAIALDPMDPLPHAVAAHSAFYFSYDWAAAQRHFERAVEIAPNHPIPLAWLGFFDSSVGRHAEAIATTKKAVSLDPLNLLIRVIGVFCASFARRFDDVIALSDEMAEIDPNFSEAYRIRSYALLQKGRVEEARRAAETSIRLSGGHPYHVFHLALVHLAAGERQKAEAIAAQFAAMPASQSVYHLLVGNLQGPLGNHDVAFAALDRYFEARGHWMAMLRADPLYDPLRNDPRFDDLVRRVGVPDWGPQPARVEPPPQARPSIAVLPLTNMSASADDEYFSDGVTEDIIAQLSQIASIRVISRTSVMRYKKTDEPLKAIAAQLGASHIVEGSVRRAGQKLRIVAQLVDAATDDHIWAHTFDRDASDVFAVQAEVAEQVAAALRAKLAPAERSRIARRPTHDDEAYNLFLLARHHQNSATADGFGRAMELYRRALDRDPRFARAWGTLAAAHHFHLAGYYGARPREVAEKVVTFASRALALDPEIAEAHMMLGYVDEFVHYDRESQGTRKELAVKLSPNLASAHLALGNYFVVSGRYDDAMEEARIALELDPASELTHLHANWLRYLTRHLDEALIGLETAEGQFGQKLLPLVRGETLLTLGRTAEAVTALETLCAHAPITLNFGVLAWMLAGAGREADARRVLRDLHDRESREFVWPMPLAAAYAHLGEMDTAFRYLSRSVDERVAWVHMPFAPTFDPFRGDPRFDEIVRRVGAIAPRSLASQRS